MRSDEGKQGQMYGDVADKLDDLMKSLFLAISREQASAKRGELLGRIDAVRPVTRNSDIEPIVVIALEMILWLWARSE